MTIFNQSNDIINSKKSQIKKRLRNEDPADIDGYLGPWAGGWGVPPLYTDRYNATAIHFGYNG